MRKPTNYKKFLFLPWYFALFQIVLGMHIVHPYLHSHGHNKEHSFQSLHHCEASHSTVSISEASPLYEHRCAICELLAANPVFASWHEVVFFHADYFQPGYYPSIIKKILISSPTLFIRGPPTRYFS